MPNKFAKSPFLAFEKWVELLHYSSLKLEVLDNKSNNKKSIHTNMKLRTQEVKVWFIGLVWTQLFRERHGLQKVWIPPRPNKEVGGCK